MKRTAKYALSAVLSAALAASVLAQENFPDVPANHWAYEAVARLKKDGILVGYPSGLYNGARPATRYELAAAVHAAYINLKNQSDGLASQVSTLSDKVNSGVGVSKADVDNLKAAVAAQSDQLKAMQSYGDDISALKKLTDEFKKELASMGVDVEALKKGLSDLSDRVTALEKRKLPVDISGDVNALILGGYSIDNQFGITVDGRPTGYRRGSTSGQAGATNDLTVGHELALTLKSTADGDVKWHGTVVVGNLLGSYTNSSNLGVHSQVLSTTSTTDSGVPFSEAYESIYIHDLGITWSTKVMSYALGLEAGRVGIKTGPLMFQRPQILPQFDNERWHDGKYLVDGLNANAKFGPVSIGLFGGRTSDQTTSYGDSQQLLTAGRSGVYKLVNSSSQTRPVGLSGNLLTIDQVLGVTAGFNVMKTVGVNLGYLWLDADNRQNIVGPNATPANGVHVYGGDLNFTVGGVKIDGAYSKSDVVYQNANNITKENDAWFVNASKDFLGGKLGVGGGYEQIAPQFGAPGDWGRIGIWWNPTDIQGWKANVNYKVSDAVKVYAKGQFLTGTGKQVTTDDGITPPPPTTGVAPQIQSTSEGLSTNDQITSYVVGVAYNFAKVNTFDVSWERVDWNLKSRFTGTVGNQVQTFQGGKPYESWLNLGYNRQLSENAFLKFLWQFSDYDSKGTGNGAFNPFAFGGNTAHGGLLTTQLTVKF